MGSSTTVGAVQVAALLMAGLALSGCETFRSDAPQEAAVQTNDGEVLNTTETAPADLQLTCSSAAATQFGISPDKLLPVASSKLPDDTYEVQLTADGRNFVCKVDNNANVISVLPV